MADGKKFEEVAFRTPGFEVGSRSTGSPTVVTLLNFSAQWAKSDGLSTPTIILLFEHAAPSLVRGELRHIVTDYCCQPPPSTL
jgi:hypothetical protein